MDATVIVGILCLHLLCFGAMFLLFSSRLRGKKLGMDVLALGNFMLGTAYVLQLWGGPPGWNLISVINHTLTLCTPAVYFVGAMRFFGRPTPLLRPLLVVALAYTAAQAAVQWGLGTLARYAMLSGLSALIFMVMAATAVQGVRSFARDLRAEMLFFAVLIGGIGTLNAWKCVNLLINGMAALDMDQRFQLVFYGYMSVLAVVLAPAMIWLVLRRLTDDLRATAARDPLTGLLNRRGMTDALEAHLRTRGAGTAHLLLVDVDHFKRINDTHGHKAGDVVLCRVAEVMRATLRHHDLACRAGGEEFVAICLTTRTADALQLAERLRAAIEAMTALTAVDPGALIRCTATIGVSDAFTEADDFDRAMQQADDALYRGKAAGRNRVCWAGRAPDTTTCADKATT